MAQYGFDVQTPSGLEKSPGHPSMAASCTVDTVDGRNPA